MAKAYRIKGWNDLYENSESRKIQSKSIKFVIVPNKQDGKGYGRISQEKDGIQIFGAWNLIIQVASKMPERGLLIDEDGPLDFSDLEFMTRYPESLFERAFDFLSSSKIGWIEIVDVPECLNLSGRIEKKIPMRPGVSGRDPDPSRSGPEKSHRIEGNRIEGIEENGTEPNEVDLPLGMPSLKMMKKHFKELGLSEKDAEQTFYKWLGNGFTNDGKYIHRWKAVIQSWYIAGIFQPETNAKPVNNMPEPDNWRQKLDEMHPEHSFKGNWDDLCTRQKDTAQAIIDN